jgi:hypothetical protein
LFHLLWSVPRHLKPVDVARALERVPINWNQLIGKTTLYFKVLERLAFAQSGEKRSKRQRHFRREFGSDPT